MIQRIIDWVKKYKYILLIFLLATSFFIIQHIFVLSWDFISYTLNARHIFDNGIYFETFRPPLTSFIIGLIAQISGYPASEIIYIVLVNILFCISVVLLSKRINFNSEIFYLILLTPLVLFYGLLNGTELLSITLLMFGIYFILKNNWVSGLFIGLSALTRYSGIAFGLFLLFHKGIKNKIKSIILFCITFVPWLIYNRIELGNFFTSVADQYFQNIVSRIGVGQTPQLLHFIYIQSILFLFTIFGLIFVIYKCIQSIRKSVPEINVRLSIIMLLLSVFTIFAYFTTPFKDLRYLFPMMLPIAYFTYIGIIFVLSKINNNKQRNLFSIKLDFRRLYWILIILLLISSVIILIINYNVDGNLKEKYTDAITIINTKSLQECVMYSDNWIFFNYLDKNIVLLPIEIYPLHIDAYTQKVLFLDLNNYNLNTLNLLQNKFPTIYKNNQFIILGNINDCKKKADYPILFYSIFKKGVINNPEVHIYTEPCNILFNSSRFITNMCNYFNYDLFPKK